MCNKTSLGPVVRRCHLPAQALCLLVSALVITPPLLGITLYKMLPGQQLFVLKFDKNIDSIEANIVGVAESSRVTKDLFGFLKSERGFDIETE